jgi:aminopeptidase N
MTRGNISEGSSVRHPAAPPTRAGSCRQRLPRVALLLAALVATGAIVAQASFDPVRVPDPPVRPEVAGETPKPLPWDIDPALSEAPLKAAYYRGLTRWSEEPTANELAMDAVYYGLTLTVSPSAQQINGHLQADLRVTAAQVSVVDLDLAPPLTVTSVTCAGLPATYVHANEILTITLNRPYRANEIVTVTVDYRGTPSSTYGAFGFDIHGGYPMVWTLSEPFGARSWWPCDDWSDDKADSMDITVTVPSGLIVASNGTLQEVIYGSGVDTYAWHVGYPISTYLVSLAIHPYTVYSDYYQYAPSDSMEITFFIFPDDYEDTYEVNMMTAGMIEHFASVYGEYPFLQEKYGHAEFPWGGAMEHQTCTSIGAFFESIVAHELSHQWWGDMVTCADFHHVWLNEGFATYSEAVWLEHNYGAEGYWGQMNSARYYGPGSIYVPVLDDWGRIFDGNLSYNKGSWVLHMLRHVLGDADFFATLAAYRAAYEYGSATTEDLQAVAESISGLELTDFFQQWIYGEYFPRYGFAWESVAAPEGDELHLTIEQLQTTGLFHMPIDVRVHLAGGGVEDFVIDNALAQQAYVLALSGPAESVELDPGNWILKQVQEAIVNPTFEAGILLVNGINWYAYGSEVTSAYEDRAFWGTLDIDFWDYFDEPDGGYPATLPAPLGHGRVPSSVLGQYATVIWLGNNYGGDLSGWMETSVLPYLEAGGNVLLMTRYGSDFLGDDLAAYLGITFTAGTTINYCTSAHPLLTDIARLGTQSGCSLFSLNLQHETSTQLYIDTSYNPDRGVGVLRTPAEGGWANPNGGRFAFLSGRPYRWNHTDLATNVETIVNELFAPSQAVPDAGRPAAALALRVENPALGPARIQFTLPQAEPVSLALYDCQGRLVRRLIEETLPAGEHGIVWDGCGTGRGSVPAGVYYARLQASGRTVQQALLRVR